LAKISLEIDRGTNRTAARIGYELTSTRIFAQVALRTAIGWTDFEAGVVDTGAVVSLFPAGFWRCAEYQLIGDVQVSGAVPLEQCRIRAKLARVCCTLSDGIAVIGPFNIHAYLAESDEVPLLLGVADLIQSGTLVVAIDQQLATFETKDSIA
jgi:hypothetical protein